MESQWRTFSALELSIRKLLKNISFLLKFDHKPDGSRAFITGLDLIFIVDVSAVVFIVVVIVEEICRCLSLQ